MVKTMRNVWCVGLFVVSACATAACGGGGGGGGSAPGGGGPLPATPTPVPTATPTPGGHPYSLPSPGPVNASAYTVDSNPRGLAVTLDGTAAGTTPATISPAYAANLHTIAIAPGGAATPFAVSVAQTANGSHTIFYNGQAETFGKIGSLSTSSERRRPGLLRRALPQRLAGGVANRPLFN